MPEQQQEGVNNVDDKEEKQEEEKITTTSEVTTPSPSLTNPIEIEIDDLRQRGNHEFQQQQQPSNIENAITFYTMAIDKCLQVGVKFNIFAKSQYIINLCNRSACYYILQEYEKSRVDANIAWDISDQDNIKASYRLCKTLIALKEYGEAITTINLTLESYHDP